MSGDARAVRGDRPFVLASCFMGQGIDEILLRIAPVIDQFAAAVEVT
jgi:Ni2+-binding GTPase involved in maturation of urease and hydrogenase